MKHRLIWFLAAGTLIWSACKNDPNATPQIGDGPNASIINNPLTANLPTDTNQLARIKFEEMEYDFGDVKEGDVKTHEFKFTNTGKVPLTILKAYSSCGCTVPDWPEEPIAPGSSSQIAVKFNSKGKKEQQGKVVKIIANTLPNETHLKIRAFVKEN